MTLKELLDSYHEFHVRDYVEVSCGLCKVSYKTTKRSLYMAVKTGQSAVYCKDCKHRASVLTRGNEEQILVPCGTCGKEIKKRPKDIKNSVSTKVFCSQSCAAKYNNANSELLKASRKVKTKTCKTCSTLIFSDATYCLDCFNLFRLGELENKTKGELLELYGRYGFHSRIRGHAKTVMKNTGKKKVCSSCGYSKHVEVCHIKDVKDFTNDAKKLKI